MPGVNEMIKACHLKNYSIYTKYKNNNVLSDIKKDKNEDKNPKLNKNFSSENQAKNYQDIPKKI